MNAAVVTARAAPARPAGDGQRWLDMRTSNALVLHALMAGMLSAGSATASDDQPSVRAVSGTYQAISESEWSEEITLQEDGSVFLLTETWLAGDPGSITTHEYIGRWKLEGSVVEVELLESKTGGLFSTPNVALFQYNAHLSLEEIGREESVPGLSRQGCSDEGSSIYSWSLWRKDALARLRWP